MIEGGDAIERLYQVAKAGHWVKVLAALVGEPEMAIACSRYRRPSSGWAFLHQAAYFGQEDAARALIRLGASSTCESKGRETAGDVAAKQGHVELARVLRAAASTADGPWGAPVDLDRLPSSCAWSEGVERRATRELRVAYGGAVVTVHVGGRYFVDSFGRTLVGWHGTHDPPCGMDSEPMIGTLA